MTAVQGANGWAIMLMLTTLAPAMAASPEPERAGAQLFQLPLLSIDGTGLPKALIKSERREIL